MRRAIDSSGETQTRIARPQARDFALPAIIV